MAKSIMIIDDSPTLRHVVSTALRDMGYETVEAVDGADAIDKLGGQSLSLIICDVNMPNMDGLTFLREVKQMKEYRFVPILMLTTEAQPGKRQEAREAGARAWIVKPFRIDQLTSAVQKLIR